MPGSLWLSGSLALAPGALQYAAGDANGKPYLQSPDLVLQRHCPRKQLLRALGLRSQQARTSGSHTRAVCSRLMARFFSSTSSFSLMMELVTSVATADACSK